MPDAFRIGTTVCLGFTVTAALYYWLKSNRSTPDRIGATHAFEKEIEKASSASDDPSLAFIRRMAKAELHCHLNGSVRPSTLSELSGEVEADTLETDVVHTIEDAFKLFARVYRVVTTESVLRRIVRETLEDALGDNVIYLELRTTPRLLNDVPSREEYVRIVIDEISKFSRINTNRPLMQFPSDTIAVRLILTVDRTKSIATAEETVDIALKFRDMVVGIDFAGNPTVGSFSEFANVFQRAANHGLCTTIHTSEVQGVQEETDAILEFKPDRVGHFLFPTDSQVQKLLTYGIKIESCPSSNMCAITGKNPLDGDLNGHSTLDMFIRTYPHLISINTDDPGVFGRNLSDELFAVSKTYSLSSEEVCTLIRGSGNHAFINPAERMALGAYLGVAQ